MPNDTETHDKENYSIAHYVGKALRRQGFTGGEWVDDKSLGFPPRATRMRSAEFARGDVTVYVVIDNPLPKVPGDSASTEEA